MTSETLATKVQEFSTVFTQLNKSEITELKVIRTPAAAVQKVLLGLSYILNPPKTKKSNTWKDAKLADKNFINSLKEVDVKTLEVKQCVNALKAIDGLTAASVKSCSNAA